MKRITLLMIAICFSFSCGRQDELVPLTIDEKLDQLIHAYTDFGFLSGVSVGIWKDEKARIFHFGKSDPEKGFYPTDTTLYALGGLSQVFTGVLASDLIQEGRLQLNDTLNNRLPGSLPVFGNEKITVVDLATHTSGLVSEALGNYLELTQAEQALAYRDFEPANLYQFLSTTQLLSAPGTRYLYSRLGMAVLGQVIETEAEMPIDDFFQERIAKPIGMRNTRTLPGFTQLQFDHLAPAYDQDQQKLQHYRYGVMEASSGFYSTVEDMIKFVAVQMNLFHSISDALEFSHVSRFDLGSGNEVAMGWLKEYQAGDKILFQSGAVAHAAYIGFNPDKQIGVVVLTNTNSESSVRVIGRDILNFLWR